MHPPHVRAKALALVEQGLNDYEISLRMGIPRGTIRDWRIIAETEALLARGFPHNPVGEVGAHCGTRRTSRCTAAIRHVSSPGTRRV